MSSPSETAPRQQPSPNSLHFRPCPDARRATSLLDCAVLANGVLMPWVGVGTYRLGAAHVVDVTRAALVAGYRQIDTAFVYGGERTERLVGQAIAQALAEGILEHRADVFVTTKQWRTYHGYDKTLLNLQVSLRRLGLDYIDLWLMHHPGPAWQPKRPTTTSSATDDDHTPDDDLWTRTLHPDVHSPADMDRLRGETWRAMEEAYRRGLVRAIGVCNFSLPQVERLALTATIAPMVLQIEVHPLHPQTALLDYCAAHGIVVTAYASLGGQDTNRAQWAKLLGPPPAAVAAETLPKKRKKGAKEAPTDLLYAAPVRALAARHHATPAQVLLRWALERGCAVIPKSNAVSRLQENAQLFGFRLAAAEVDGLVTDLSSRKDGANNNNSGRLCWRGDPLRTVDY
jgi:diketogulonate reductase-like aldo/keto reductase